MTDLAAPDTHGRLIEPTTLEIQRHLPGPIERIWAYLTDSALRARWLAAGPMELELGAPFELVWHNDQLTDPPGARPPDLAADCRMQSRIVALDPPRLLTFTWGEDGEVTFRLESTGTRVLLTLIHRRLPDRPTMLMVAAGWHTHLDILVARATGAATEPFWDGFLRRKAEYERLLPG
jgi:uncharacterized protein YndB with AHSA1/START domain